MAGVCTIASGGRPPRECGTSPQSVTEVALAVATAAQTAHDMTDRAIIQEKSLIIYHMRGGGLWPHRTSGADGKDVALISNRQRMEGDKYTKSGRIRTGGAGAAGEARRTPARAASGTPENRVIPEHL